MSELISIVVRPYGPCTQVGIDPDTHTSLSVGLVYNIYKTNRELYFS